MVETLMKLGFVGLKEYFKLYGLNVSVDNVFIKYKTILQNVDFTNRFPYEEVLKQAILRALQKDSFNAIASGYQKGGKLICISPNSTLNLIKTEEWKDILKVIGDELFIHILSDCNIVCMVNNNKILVAGNLRNCMEKKSKQRCITRHRIFFKDNQDLKFDPHKFLDKVNSDLIIPNEFLNVLRAKISEIDEKYKKTKIKLIFRNYNLHKEMKELKQITEIEYKEIVDFLFCISKKIFKGIFSYYNFRILKQKLTLLICKNRFETLSEEELIRHFRIKQFPWGKGEQKMAHKLSLSVLFYLFEDFYIPQISKFFYSTESCHGKLRVSYYSRIGWYKFSDYHINNFISNMCDKDSRTIIDDSRSHNLRCIPKKEGGRVVVNLSKKLTDITPNQFLNPHYLILKEEVRHKLGNSALGYEDMYKLLYPFLNTLENAFVVKLDLKKCFDNIPHKYIKRMIDTLYEKDSYCVKKFTTLGWDCSTLKLGKYHTILSSDIPSDTLYNQVSFPTRFIYKDEVYTNILDREDILRTLHKMVFDNKIIYRKFMYTQSKGIPQGSVFSTLLCSLYLKEIDIKYFDRVIKKGRIVRFVDDYLIITPSSSEIQLFMKVIDKMKSIGLEFNMEKVESNLTGDKNINWCGMKIISKASGHKNKIYIKMNLKEKVNQYGVAFPSISSGSTISNRMKTFFKSRTPEILFCRENKMVYQNIFDFFLLYKIRLQTLFSRAPFINKTFYQQILFYSVKEMISLCKRRNIKCTERLILNISKTAFGPKK